MEWTFTLPDGTRAGIKPIQGLTGLTGRELGVGCLTPNEDVSVVFYVPNREALDRIRKRFGLPAC